MKPLKLNRAVNLVVAINEYCLLIEVKNIVSVFNKLLWDKTLNNRLLLKNYLLTIETLLLFEALLLLIQGSYCYKAKKNKFTL